jgi:hypothetical protein
MAFRGLLDLRAELFDRSVQHQLAEGVRLSIDLYRGHRIGDPGEEMTVQATHFDIRSAAAHSRHDEWPGPDAVIEAVGMESHGAGGIMETLQSKLTSTKRPYALKQAILCLPAGWDGPASRRVRRRGRSRTPWRLNRQGTDAQDGPNACAALPQAADETDRREQDRPVVPDHASRHPRRTTGGVQDLPRQAGRLRQGGYQTEWLMRTDVECTVTEQNISWEQDGIDTGWFFAKNIGSVRSSTSYRSGGWWFLAKWLPDTEENDIGPFQSKTAALAEAERLAAQQRTN